jgi:phage/plasmid-associated DNA primase
MTFTSEPTFDIRNFAHQLTQAKKGRYNCPNCGKPKLSIDRHSGKYQCWNCYDTKAIAKRCCEAQIAKILTAPEREERQRHSEFLRLANSFSPQEREAEWINGSGVAPEITAKNIRHIDHAPAIAQLLNWNWYGHTGGWYVSSCDPKTGMRGKSGQFKPDTPIQFPDHNEPQKYLSFPKGGKSAAVYLVVTLDFWHHIGERFGVPVQEDDIKEDRDDLGFWLWVLNHPELPIVFTEGAKKAACLLSHGWIAISISGVWMGQEGKGAKLHPTISPFIVPGRPVYLAFDADIIVKESVSAALRQLGRLIKKERAEVFVTLWHLDQGKGADDLIVAEGATVFEQAFDEALPYSQWLKSLQADNNGGLGSGNLRGGGNGCNGGGDDSGSTPDKTNPEWFYERICKQLGLPFENCVTATTFDGWVYRREFGATQGDWRVIDSAFYQWLDHLGYWQHQKDTKINAQIADAGEKAFKLKHSKEFGWQVVKPYETNSHKESSFKYVRSRLDRLESLPSNTHLVAFKNCVVDMISGQTMPHSKDYFLTSIIPYDYEPGKECPEVFRNFVAESFGEDMLPIIRAFTSMFLDPTAPYGRFPHIVGQSGGGKGTLGRFWNSLWGQASDSAVNFSEIATPEGRHQFLTGKRIFGFPDVGGFVQGVRAFYELVDNGELSGRALFNPVGYMKLWNVRFWVASVDFLQVENAGDGYARRAYLIPVKSRTVKPDPDLKLKLEAVKAAVISWALAMPREERDRILLEEPENERVVNLRLDAALYGDSTKSFVDNCLRPTHEPGFMHHHLLHTVYTAYCKEHGYTPLGMTKFISHLKTVLPNNFVQRRWGSMSNGKRNRVPAHWEYVTTVPGAFVSISHQEGFRNSSENAPPPTDPIWVCRKSKCEEGGLMEFADFWNPPSPPDDDGGDWGGGDNNPYTPPTPFQPYEGVQGGSKNQAVSNCTVDNPEQREIKGVQGGSTVQPGDLVKEKSTVAVLEKIEPEISSTSISSGGQSLDTLDKKPEQAAKEPQSHTQPGFKAQVGLKWSEPSLGSEPDYSTFPHRSSDNLRAKIKQAFRIKQQLLSANNKDELVAIIGEHGENQVNWVWCTLLTESEQEKVRSTAQTEQLNLLEQSNSREDSPQSNDPWLEQENLEGMARDLDSCPDRDTLACLRLCWPPYAMNAACKLLSLSKHAQIKQWVLELNQLAAGD